MSDDPRDVEVDGEVLRVEAIPTSFTYHFEQGGLYTLDDGSTIRMVEMVFRTVIGPVKLFMPQPDAVKMADDLRKTAGGLTLAHSMPPGG